jgi:hypothetical protein
MLGIEITQPPIPGMIALYEEHDTRVEAGYRIDEWYDLHPRERATEVALYRIRHSLSYQKAKAEQRNASRKQ